MRPRTDTGSRAGGSNPGRRSSRGLPWYRAISAMCLAVLPAPAVGQARDVAMPPGINFGGSVGLIQFRGAEHSPIENAHGWEFFLGYGLSNGLYGRIGGLLSAHDVAPDAPDYQFLTFFLEPRYVLLDVSPHVAPFVAGRAGWAHEKVLGSGYSLKADGSLLAGGGGVLLRAAPQIALELGLLLGRARFGDFTFKGNQAWYLCLNDLEEGTPMPASTAGCAGSRSFGGVIRLCYPPFFPDEETGECDPPDVPYEGTGRSGSWLRAWIGVHLSVSTVLGR